MKDLSEKYKSLVESSGFLTLGGIKDVNFKPHPFMVGVKHITYASDHCGGILGQEVLEKIPCAHPGCHLPYDQHTHDTVMFLKLTRNATETEAREALKSLSGDLEVDGVDGFAFIKTDFEFIKEE